MNESIEANDISKNENGEYKIIPTLDEWEPTDDEIYFYFDLDSKVVKANYERILELEEQTLLSTFYIEKKHYKDRMIDVCKHINYFITFYDSNNELFMSILSLKYTIDQRVNMRQSLFRQLVLDRVITDDFIKLIKKMTHDLIPIAITDIEEEKYRGAPKIVPIQARQIMALSFCFRMILPLLLHYSNTNNSFVNKKDYIKCFKKIFLEIIERFEKDDIAILVPIIRFTEHRISKFYRANKGIWSQKQLLYGITLNTYTTDLIHEVIVVKSLHKLNYRMSAISFIDGIISQFGTNFLRENYKSKPFEINTVDENTSDNDDQLVALSRNR